MHIFPYFLSFSYIFANFAPFNRIIMSERFPYGYDVNAYIDKAFEQMKADFPWATREMIAENTNLGIEKMEGEYQYVSYHSRYDGTLKAYKEDVTGIWSAIGFKNISWAAIRLMSRQATARLVGRRRSSSLLLISNCLGKCSLTSTSIWSSPAHTM